MARRREIEAPPDVRGKMAASYREDAEQYYPVAREVMGAGCDPAGWLAKANALDAGDPVLVHGWELCGKLPGVDPYDDFRLEPDGTVTRMRRVHHGDVVDYMAADG